MQSLDTTFAALSDPTRRAILSRLASGEATVMDLSQPFDMSQPAISRHLRVLEEAGLITRRVEGAKRPCRLAPAGIAEIDRWLDVLRETLETNYARLDNVLAAQTAARTSDRKRKDKL
jgi:DNA-binding transcriptional ArsR family regulator